MSEPRLKERHWTVERSVAWLDNFRRPAVRRHRPLTIYQAFLDLARFMIGLRRDLK